MGFTEAQYAIDEILKGVNVNIVMNMSDARLVVRSDVAEDEGKTITITGAGKTLNKLLDSNLSATFDLPGKQRYDLKVKKIAEDGNFTVEYHTTIDLSAGEYKDVMVGLRTDTWQGLQNILNAGLARKYVQIGHEMKVRLSTGEDVIFQVAAINHENANDLIFISKECLQEQMKLDNGTAHEWPKSKSFKNTTLGTWLSESFFKSLPQDLQNVIKTRTFKTYQGTSEGNMVSNNCKIWIPRSYEVFGYTSSEYYQPPDETTECKQFPIFPSQASRVKKLGLKGNSNRWWLATCPKSTVYFSCFHVLDTGAVHTQIQIQSYNVTMGVVPCFIMTANS